MSEVKDGNKDDEATEESEKSDRNEVSQLAEEITSHALGEEHGREKYIAIDRDYAETPEVLGSYVRDKITKFEGIAVSYTQFLTGCNRIGVQPKVSMLDRKVPDAYTFDESHVEILAPSKLADKESKSDDKSAHDRGGPPSIAPRM